MTFNLLHIKHTATITEKSMCLRLRNTEYVSSSNLSTPLTNSISLKIRHPGHSFCNSCVSGNFSLFHLAFNSGQSLQHTDFSCQFASQCYETKVKCKSRFIQKSTSNIPYILREFKVIYNHVVVYKLPILSGATYSKQDTYDYMQHRHEFEAQRLILPFTLKAPGSNYQYKHYRQKNIQLSGMKVHYTLFYAISKYTPSLCV